MRLLAPLFSILILSTAAAAASSPDPAAEQRHGAAITDFAGPWIGRTDPGSDRVRNATLLIEHFAGDVFRITWTSFEADPRTEGGVAKRERSLVFRPSSVPGIWIADPSDDPFMLLGAWARFEDGALVIDTTAITPEGRLERQTYRRTRTDEGLKLTYRRWLDHTLDREIEADYLRL